VKLAYSATKIIIYQYSITTTAAAAAAAAMS